MSAAEKLREAEQQLETARRAVEMARQQFLGSPSVTAEEKVEDAERHVRRAERFRDARALAAEHEREAQQCAEREQAKARRDELLVERGQLHAQVRERLRDVTSIYAQLNDVVSSIDALVQQDAVLAKTCNDLAAAAGESARIKPFSTEELRLAVNAELGATWDDRPRGDADLRHALRTAGTLESPGTPAEVYARIEMVLAEADHAFGAAPLARWLATLREPKWDDRSPAADRARHALKLREQLKGDRS